MQKTMQSRYETGPRNIVAVLLLFQVSIPYVMPLTMNHTNKREAV